MLLSSACQSSFPSTSAYNQYLQPYTPILFSDNLSLKAIALPSPRPLNASNTTLRHVSGSIPHDEPPDASDTGGCEMVSSASAVSAAIRRASTSPVEFSQRIENDSKQQLVLPSPDFQRLCLEQLGLFRRIVDSDAVLSVFVRPAGSYVMDRLELRRVSAYPAVHATDIVVLVGTFRIPTGLRSAEAALSSQQVEVVAQQRALVFPMVKEPFVVGFLVAEVSDMDMEAENRECDEQNDVKCPSPQTDYALRPRLDAKSWEVQSPESELWRFNVLTAEQRSNAIYIARSLAMAYVMDQKAMLLQQSSWQNNVRMSALVEQIRGPLSSVRTLTKMLSTHVKRNEISYDIVEDILVQSDRMRDTLQELQDAVYLTKANIVRYNKETLRKMNKSAYSHPKSMRSPLLEDASSDDKLKSSGELLSLSSAAEDLELPMPPHALAPLQQQGIRPCDVSDVLSNLVDAMRPLAHKQRRLVEFSNLSLNLQVAIEEPALRQALSNLIEGALLRTQAGGKVEIVSTGAPAGGTLVVIDDDGPDMHFMTQMHSLTPFGPELLSEDRVEDNMTWNFVASLTVAREILESSGCVVRVISPRSSDAALGAGGTRVELWLPAFAASSDSESNGRTCDA